MGVGMSMGLDPMVVAAPIIGGAISPLSDSTNAAAGSTEVDLLQSVKYQITTTGPAALIYAAVYCIWGMRLDLSGADMSAIEDVIASIEASYKLGGIPLIPMVVVLVMLALKVPSIPSILCGSISGLLVAWLYQGQSLKDVIQSMWSGYVLESDNAFVAQIFTCGVIYTIILGFIANVTSASGNFSFVFTGNLMAPVYEKNHMNKLDLTRAMSVGCLLSGLLVPWNANPMTVCGFLGVEPSQMLRYMFTPFVTAGVLIFLVATGIDKKFSKLARGETE